MTALIVILAVAVTVAALVGAAAWLDRPRPALRWADARLAGWLSPPPGDHHKFAAPDAAPLTPAPEGAPGQESRPGDPPWVGGAVRAGATPQPPGLGRVVFGPVPETPALPAAAQAGQATGPGGYPVPPEEATTAPPGATWPGAGPGHPPSPGPGRHPRQPWLYTVGYGPFERGPRAVIPAGRVSLRVTGELLAVPDRPRLVGGHVTDHDAWWDRPVNQP